MSNSKNIVPDQGTDIPASGDHYKAVAEATTDAIITINANSTILLVNPAAEQIFGYTKNEMLGRQLTILMPKYHRHLHREGMARYLETGRRHLEWGAVQLPGLHKDGGEISLEISFLEFTKDEQRFFTGIIRKVVGHKKTQAASDSRDLLSAIVNQASVGISVVDSNGQFTFVNNWFCQLLGRTREQLLKITFADITPAEDLQATQIMFKRAIGDGESFEIEKRYVHSNGSLVSVLDHVNILYDETGLRRGILSVTLDLAKSHDYQSRSADDRELWR
jgi:PAS domain S-box-containing protein